MDIKRINCVHNEKAGLEKKTKNPVANKNEQLQINELSNICYKPLSFGRSWAEHKSWGAVIDPKTKETTFKILTFPDTQKVTVTVKKANDETKVKEYELENKGDGIFATNEPIKAGEIEDGDKYFYSIYRNGSRSDVKDPYSFKQEQLLGESVIYDHSKYKWNDKNWFTSNKSRISRTANKKNNLTPLNAARIYEFNTATLTKDGTFEAVKSELKRIKNLGFNAIELMPVENTYSFNWGYDGVDKFAPAQYLGGPDKLKELIDYAHQMGINVIMDIVPNHLGPDGSSLGQTGPYIKGPNPFGSAFNFEGQNSRYVRDFIINSAVNWLENYHCDGLRLDMTRFMESDHTMKQLAAEINYHKPEAFIIAEDGRGNDRRVTGALYPAETGEGINEEYHVHVVNDLSSDKGDLSRLGYDSEWDFQYYHKLSDVLYDNVDLDAFEQVCYDAQTRVKYVSSHDEQGNFEGTAFIAKHMVPMLRLNDNVILDEEDRNRAMEWSKSQNKPYEETLRNVLFQKAQMVSEKLAIMFQTGELQQYSTKRKNPAEKNALNERFTKEVLVPLGIKEDSHITYDDVKIMFNKSFIKQKQGLTAVYSTPGPKMVFQGDESADLTPFRFFRQFQSIPYEHYLYTEKGYQPGKPALEESKLGSIKYTQSALYKMGEYSLLTKALNKIVAENPALTTGAYIQEDTVKHPYSHVIGMHCIDKDSDNEIFTVHNFSDYDYPRDDAQAYYIKFPPGKWVEILNTDDKKFGGKGNITYYEINANGNENRPIHISRESSAIFKRIA